MSRPSHTAPEAAEEAGQVGQSIALRAFGVLEQIGRAEGPMSLDELTQAMGLPKPTVFRILNMLQEAHLLRKDSMSKRYTAGPRLTAFGMDLWRSHALRAPWRQALEQAVREVGESCNLTVLENNRVLYLDRVETDRPLRLHLQPGTRVPLHCTASGKLFLAAMAPHELEHWLRSTPLERYTDHTLTDPQALLQDIERVRQTQVGMHDSEMFEDSVAMGVPVLDRAGRLCAVVAMHAPSTRETVATVVRHLPVLRRTAALVSATMGMYPKAGTAAAPLAQPQEPGA